MKFGPVPVDEAEGAMLAHATAANGHRWRKAHRLTREDISLLKEAGVCEVVAAVLSEDDLDENASANRIAQAMSFSGIVAKPAATGRVNLHAAHAGLFVVDRAQVDRLNRVDPAITLATVAEFRPVETNDMVATVKVIPFAASRKTVDDSSLILSESRIFSVYPYRAKTVTLVQTVLPGMKHSVLDKTARVTASRLSRYGSVITEEVRTAHETEALAGVIAALAGRSDIVIVFGASALCDFDDIIPSAIRKASGTVLRAGMPVDPGNLLVLGRVAQATVIGAPGCARSPKENGFDWVLDRISAGLEVGSEDIAGMGVGGLLTEIPSRPQPRESSPTSISSKVHAIVLAAGRSSRMGGSNKLLAHFSGRPLIRLTVERVLASSAESTLVVTGHQAERIGEAIRGAGVQLVHNGDFAHGLSTSLKAGIHSLPPEAAGALIILGDMPGISTADLDRLMDNFHLNGGSAIVRATHEGQRGNPIILPRSLFDEVSKLEGDTGARHLIDAQIVPVIDVEIGKGASIDVDTRDALESAGGVLQD